MDTKSLPTKNNLMRIRNSIQQSKEGRMLLEQKKIILQHELEKYVTEAKKLKEESQQVLEEAYYYLKLANVEIGMDDMMDIADGVKIDTSLDIKYVTIMGVELPSIVSEALDVGLGYGLYHTTAAVDKAILKFMEVKKYIIQLAQLENTILRLEKNIEKVARRSNALKEIIIPENEKLAMQIEEILDENEKEEFTRLKKLKGKGKNTNVKK